MKRLLLSFLFCLSLFSLQAQESVSIGTTSIKSSAILWLNGNGTQGLLLPVALKANFTPSADEKGMMIYDSGSNKVWYWNGTSWVEVAGGSGGDAQQLSKSGNQIQLTNSVSIPIAATAPTINGQILVWNGTQWTASTATAPANGQVLKWDGSSWAPAADNSGSGTSPTLSNGELIIGNGTTNSAGLLSGDATLSGATLTISNNAVGSAEITNASITGADIAASTITSSNILDGTIAAADLNAMSATNGQVLTFNGTVWAPATPSSGGSTTLDALTDATVTTPSSGQILINDGAGQFQNRTVSGDVTLSNTGVMTIATNSVGSAEITDATVASVDIANATITGADIASETITSSNILNGTIAAADLNSMSATNGQVLKFNGTAWAPAADDAGAGATPTLSNGQILVGNGTTNSATTLGGDATLSGGTLTIAANAIGSSKILDGSIVAADLATMSATNGQVLTFNGTTWAPSTPSSGGASTLDALTDATVTTPSSGQILINDGAGQFQNRTMSGDATLSNTGAITIASNAVGSAEISDGTVASADITDATVTGTDIAATTITAANIANSTITSAKLTNSGVTAGTYGNGTNVAQFTVDAQGRVTAASNVALSAGASTLDGLTDATVTTPSTGQILVHNGAGQFTNVSMSGDATLSSAGAVTITNNAVGSAEITDASIANGDLATGAVNSTSVLDGSLTGTDIQDGTVAAADLSAMSAATGQVLTYNGASWAPATPSTSATTLDGLTDATVTTPSSGQILINDGAGQFQNRSLSGDATVSSTGTVTISANAVGSSEISDGSVASADITDGTITGTDIASGTVTSSNIVDGTITGTDIGTGTVTSNNITDGTITALDLASMGAASGQVLKWNGTNWSPGTDNGGGGGGGGTAPQLTDGQIMIGDGTSNFGANLTGDATLAGSILSIATDAITSNEITDGTVAGNDLSTMGATNGQVLTFNGTTWAPATSSTGATTLDGLTDATVTTPSTGQILVHNGAGQFTNVSMSGDATINNAGALTIASNAIGSAEISDGTVASADITDATITGTDIATGTVTSTNILDATVTSTDIANGTIAAVDLNSMSATNGQVLTYNGAAWAPATPTTGATTLDGLTDATVTTPSTGQILVHNGAGQFTNVSMSGDATINNTGVVTIASGAVGSAEISDGTVTTTDITDATITGTDIASGTVTSANITDGTIAAADLNTMSATNGQVLTFNGTAWAPATPGTGATTLDALTDATVTTPTTGQILVHNGAGQFTNVSMSGDATINNTGVVTIASGAVGSAEISDGTVTSTDISDGTIAAADLNAMSATNGQVLTFNGTAWAPATPGTGATTLDGLTDATVTTPTAGQILVNNGAGQFTNVSMNGDATMSTTGAVTISSSAIGSAEITDASITGTDIASGTVTSSNILDGTIAAADLNTMSATNGQVLTFNGTAWAPAAATGATTLDGLTDATVTTPSTGQILVHNGAGQFTNVSMSGDATITNTGALTIASNAVGSAEITNASITGTDIAASTIASGNITDGTITGTDIASSTIASSNIIDGTIAAADLSSMSATNSQVLQYNGTAWAPATLTLGATTVDGLTDATVTTPSAGQILIHDGAGQFQNRTVSGDVTISSAGATSITDNSVTNAKIAAVGLGKLLQGSATTNQVLAWSGTAWAPASLFSTSNVIPKGNGSGLQVASLLYDNGTGVGINNNAPDQALDVTGNVDFSGALMPASDAGVAGQVLTSQGAGSAPKWVTSSSITAAGNGLTLTGSTVSLGGAMSTNASFSATTGNSMFYMESADAAASTKAGFLLRMNAGYIGSQYELIARKSDATANSGQSDFVLLKDFSTGGGYMDLMKIDNSTNNIMFNSGKTTASSYGNLVLSNGYFGIGTSTPHAPIQVSNTYANRKMVLYEGANDDHQFAGIGANANVMRYQVASYGSDAHVFYGGVNSTSSGEMMRIAGGYVSIGGRTSSMTGSSVFDIDIDNGAGYGGMYLNSADPDGIPFYGYGIQGSAKAWTYYNGTTGLWSIYSNSADRLSITSAGNVGIGTTSPYTNAKLDIVGYNTATDGSNGVFLDVQNSSNYTNNLTGIRFTGSSANNYKKVAIFVPYSQGSWGVSDMLFALNGASTSTLVSTTDTRMIIKSTGDVGIGIGNATPGARLDVYDAANVATSTDGIVNIGTTTGLHLTMDNNEIQAKNNTANNTLYLNYWGGAVRIADGGGATSVGGSLSVTGTLSKGSGTFKIDHPKDPENKYLYHSFVESPDMMNIYNGNVVTDANGDAIVQMPDYFSALNREFRYQLTVIGQFAQVIIFEEIDTNTNTFKIKSDKPNVKVSWQVTGVRKDPYAEKNRVQVEVEKPAEEKGKYLHPEAYGLPATKSINPPNH